MVMDSARLNLSGSSVGVPALGTFSMKYRSWQSCSILTLMPQSVSRRISSLQGPLSSCPQKKKAQLLSRCHCFAARVEGAFLKLALSNLLHRYLSFGRMG